MDHGTQPRRRSRFAIECGRVILACTVTLSAGQAIADASSPAIAPETQSATKPADASPSPIAVAAHLEHLGQAARLTFDLSTHVATQAFVLENPDRMVIESPQINFQIDPNVGRASGKAGALVKAFRFGSFAAGKSRIVIDLGGPARIQKVETRPIPGTTASHLVIELARSDRASFHQAALQAVTSQVASPPAAALPAPSGDKPVVVIDPGHGGIDPGATGVGGVQEKQLTFEFASALAAKLTATGQYSVVMTRSSDVFVSLRDRVTIARDSNAALFISIHADTVAEGDRVSGATVYTASDRASDAEAARVADQENKADQEAGAESAPDASEVSDILFDLTRRETRTFSHSFQRTLAGYWQKIAHLNKNPERSAGFWVLKAPDVPSVLLELGYLSSESDVAALTSPQWRDKASGAVAASVDKFFELRGENRQTASDQGPSQAADPDKTVIVALRPHL